jgi:hypothetical protein
VPKILVVSWWNKNEGANVSPEVTTHHTPEAAEKEAEKRKKALGTNSKVYLSKVFKEI